METATLLILTLLVAGCVAVADDNAPRPQDLLTKQRGSCTTHGEKCTQSRCCDGLTCSMGHWGDHHYCNCKNGWKWDYSISTCRPVGEEYEEDSEINASLIAACISISVFLIFAALLIFGLARTRFSHLRNRVDRLTTRARQVVQRKEDSPPSYDDVATIQIPELEVPPPSYAEILQNHVSS